MRSFLDEFSFGAGLGDGLVAEGADLEIEPTPNMDPLCPEPSLPKGSKQQQQQVRDAEGEAEGVGGEGRAYARGIGEGEVRKQMCVCFAAIRKPRHGHPFAPESLAPGPEAAPQPYASAGQQPSGGRGRSRCLRLRCRWRSCHRGRRRRRRRVHPQPQPQLPRGRRRPRRGRLRGARGVFLCGPHRVDGVRAARSRRPAGRGGPEAQVREQGRQGGSGRGGDH
jgi:hypothetical protein